MINPYNFLFSKILEIYFKNYFVLFIIKLGIYTISAQYSKTKTPTITDSFLLSIKDAKQLQ